MDVKRKKRAGKGRTDCEERSHGSGPTYFRSDRNPDNFSVPDPDTERWSDPRIRNNFPVRFRTRSAGRIRTRNNFPVLVRTQIRHESPKPIAT